MNSLWIGASALTQLIFLLALVFITMQPLGTYIARVMSGDEGWWNTLLGGLENSLYRIAGIHPDRDMNWREYTVALLLFNALGFVLLYILLRVQDVLPLNPTQLPAVSSDLAFNIAASFVTNTNWQSYAGEVTLTAFAQMVGLTVQHFLSAATGGAVLMVLIRGFANKNTEALGNFWADLVRGVVYILLPLSILFSVFLVSQGSVQTLSAPTKVMLTEATQNQEGDKVNEQIIIAGPVASQMAIKQLGTNGGGYFNANAAHPFENPTPLTAFFQMLAMLLIPAALCCTFGAMVGDSRQGWVIAAAMAILFIPLTYFSCLLEQKGNPLLTELGVEQTATRFQPGGNMEGKELRFGIGQSSIWASVTTATSNGSTNCAHDSMMPLTGMVSMIFMQLGEVVFGGVGSGLYGMLIFAIIAVFIAGLMVGRTPEYLGKKISVFEMKMASLVILIPPMLVLLGTAMAVMIDEGKSSIFNPGAHGFSEVLYAFSSAGNNNGSAFGGLNAGTVFYNITLGAIMLITRFAVIVPILAIAGALAGKNTCPPSPGTFPTHTFMFIGLLVGIIVLVGLLTFIPALALGPIAAHMQLMGN
jgi:K+-transporting ATPase ATPase A chain